MLGRGNAEALASSNPGFRLVKPASAIRVSTWIGLASQPGAWCFSRSDKHTRTLEVLPMTAYSPGHFLEQSRELRPREKRRAVEISGWLVRAIDTSLWEFKILDLSYGGCRIRTDGRFAPGETLRLGLPRCGPTDVTVRWVRGDLVGLQFCAASHEKPQRQRQSPRHPVASHVIVRRSGRQGQRIDAADISLHGCSLKFTDAPREGDWLWIKLPGLESIEAQVQWTRDFTCGVQFKTPLHPAVFDMLLVRLATTELPQTARLRC